MDVVEDEGDFLEMGGTDAGRDTVDDYVEAVRIAGDLVCGPGLAGCSSWCDDDYIAEIGGHATELGA